MEDLILLETIEKYLSNQMDAQEKTAFELVRKNTPEIDQMVVEHAMFLQQMDQYSAVKSIKQTLAQTHQNLLERGEISNTNEVSRGAQVVQLFHKYKRVAAIAASVGGVIALFISGLALYIAPVSHNNQIQQLSNDIAAIKKSQQYQGKLINEVKSKLPAGVKFISGGSGFLIDTKGYIITNAHVLKGNGAIVINSKGQELNATIIYTDVNNDLALLKIEDKDYKQPKTIPYAIRRKITDLGEEIFTLGYPRNDNDIVYGKGYLSAQTGYEGDSNSYQIQISANPGYSGAPIFNSNGELIGVISTRQKLAEGVAFAVKSTEIIDVVNALKDNETTKDINIKLPKFTSSASRNRKAQLDNLKNFMYSVRSFN